MMFNGFLVYGDSDTSDVTKSSNEPVSLAESSTSDSTRALSLESQLQATRQILKNKEETVRVQAESLALAEARIHELSRRARRPGTDTATGTLTRNYANKCGEEEVGVQVSADLPAPLTRDCSSGCCVEKADVSAAADLIMKRDVEGAHSDKLCVVEELYRECFYEAARQDELIHQLRAAQRELQARDGAQAGRVRRLQRALASRRWGLERYQDIAQEVEHLKLEVMNFINGSNNDSGVWGAGAEEELAGGLRHVSEQLLRLRDMLTNGCTCGLEEENATLRQTNDSLNQEVCQLRERVRDLEKTLEDKENLIKSHEKQTKDKDEELAAARQRLAAPTSGRADGAACDTLMSRLHQLQDLLNEKIDQLRSAEDSCQLQQETAERLREQLKKMDAVVKENSAEVRQLAAQAAQWRQRMARGRRGRTQDADARASRHSCAQHAGRCRENGESRQGSVMDTQHCDTLCGAAGRCDSLCSAAGHCDSLCSAAGHCDSLCGPARCAVTDALQLLRHKQLEQEQTIKEQESLIRGLQDQTRPSTTASDAPGCAHSLRCSHVGARWHEAGCDSARSSAPSRTARSDSGPVSPPPVPPRRLLKKQWLCGDQDCSCGSRDTSLRRYPDAALSPRSPRRPLPVRDVLSPTAEILERVERAHEALASAQRRWGRRDQRGKRQ